MRGTRMFQYFSVLLQNFCVLPSSSLYKKDLRFRHNTSTVEQSVEFYFELGLGYKDEWSVQGVVFREDTNIVERERKKTTKQQLRETAKFLRGNANIFQANAKAIETDIFLLCPLRGSVLLMFIHYEEGGVCVWAVL